jgi:hypothetical protein
MDSFYSPILNILKFILFCIDVSEPASISTTTCYELRGKGIVVQFLAGTQGPGWLWVPASLLLSGSKAAGA